MDSFLNVSVLAFAYIPVYLPFAYRGGLLLDYPLNCSEQEAVDRVKLHMTSTQLRKFIRGLRK